MQNLKLASDVTTAAAVPTGSALLPHNDEFSKKFNRADFMFDHGLAHHPLFELPALAALAARIPKFRDFVYWQNGKVKIDERWDVNPAPRLSLEDTIDGIAHNDSLVILKHAEQDPIYGPLLREILQRIYSFTSPESQADIVLGESLIFLNSPNRKTAYHLDLESNFLLQIRGLKLVHVFNNTDRTITSHEQLENHCRGNHNSATYKPERENDAHFYRLTAGHGVHFPSLGPHWVQNGDEVSISINVNFDLVSIHRRMKRVYLANRIMRRFGMNPTPPGRSSVRDSVKESLSTGVGAVLGALRSPAQRRLDREAAKYPVWRPSPIKR